MLTAWGIGPEINYFFGVNKKAPGGKGTNYPYLQAGFFYTNRSIKFDDFDRSQTGTKFRLGAGYAHMISNGAAISVLAAYDIDSEKSEDGESLSGTQFGIYEGLLIFLY